MKSLGELFNFTPEDLAANRAGQVSPRQQKRLRRRAYSGGGVLAFTITLSVGVALAALSTDNMPFALISLGFGTVFLVVFARSVHKDFRLAQSETVQKISGQPNVSQSSMSDPQSNSRNYRTDMRVGDQSFRVSNQVYFFLNESTAYHVYYVGNVVLSMERIVTSDTSTATAAPVDHWEYPSDIESLLKQYFGDAPRPIEETNDPAENASRLGAWAKSARAEIAKHADAPQYIVQYLDRDSVATVLAPFGKDALPHVMNGLEAMPSQAKNAQTCLRRINVGIEDLRPYTTNDQPAPVRKVAEAMIDELDVSGRKSRHLEAIQSDDPTTIIAGIQGLGKMREEADKIAEFSKAKDERIRRAALAALFTMRDPRGYVYAYDLAKSDIAATRASSAEKLAMIATEKEARKWLDRLLKDDEESVRLAAKRMVSTRLRTHMDKDVKAWAQKRL